MTYIQLNIFNIKSSRTGGLTYFLNLFLADSTASLSRAYVLHVWKTLTLFGTPLVPSYVQVRNYENYSLSGPFWDEVNILG